MIIRSLPGQSVPAIQRLRILLKVMLRGYAFRCLDARECQAGQDHVVLAGQDQDENNLARKNGDATSSMGR